MVYSQTLQFHLACIGLTVPPDEHGSAMLVGRRRMRNVAREVAKSVRAWGQQRARGGQSCLTTFGFVFDYVVLIALPWLGLAGHLTLAVYN